MISAAVVQKAAFLTAPMMVLVYMDLTVTIMMMLEWNALLVSKQSWHPAFFKNE